MKRNDIVRNFKKYCAECSGKCCKTSFVSLFQKEKEYFSSKDDTVSLSGGCLFSCKNGCELDIKKRPIDCLTYPYYPKFIFENNKRELSGFYIHKACPFWSELSADSGMVREMIIFWGKQDEITNEELITWMDIDGEWAKDLLEINF